MALGIQRLVAPRAGRYRIVSDGLDKAQHAARGESTLLAVPRNRLVGRLQLRNAMSDVHDARFRGERGVSPDHRTRS